MTKESCQEYQGLRLTLVVVLLLVIVFRNYMLQAARLAGTLILLILGITRSKFLILVSGPLILFFILILFLLLLSLFM